LNGEDFYPIKKVAGSGNIDTNKSYSVIDDKVQYERIYYRLKQTDYNGSTFYSNIINLKSSQTVSGLNINPNPVNDYSLKFSLNGIVKGERLFVTVFDYSGREKMREVITIKQSSNSFCLSLNSQLNPGVYFLNIKSSTGIFRKRFILK
jgi:hypothetical protein